MNTENRITVRGDAGRIFEVAADVLSWPAILPHYRYVRLVREMEGGRVVEMAARRDGIPVKWTSLQVVDPAERKIIFRHVKGPTRGMYVEWNFREAGDGLVEVSIMHEFDSPWPVVGPFLAEYVVGRFFVRNVAGKTLAAIKALVEKEGAG